MRAKLPDGLVDHFCQTALETPVGGVLIVRLGEETYSLYVVEHFFTKLLLKLEDVLERGVKADLLVMVGRRDRQSGAEKPPALQVREWE